jgi:hypothetical protein
VRPALSPGIQLTAVFCGRLTNNSFKDAIKVGERLKADVIGNLADPQIGIEQEVPGFFDPNREIYR